MTQLSADLRPPPTGRQRTAAPSADAAWAGRRSQPVAHHLCRVERGVTLAMQEQHPGLLCGSCECITVGSRTLCCNEKSTSATCVCQLTCSGCCKVFRNGRVACTAPSAAQGLSGLPPSITDPSDVMLFSMAGCPSCCLRTSIFWLDFQRLA